MKFRHLVAIGIVAIVILVGSLASSASATIVTPVGPIRAHVGNFACIAVKAVGANKFGYTAIDGPYRLDIYAINDCNTRNITTKFVNGIRVRWVPKSVEVIAP